MKSKNGAHFGFLLVFCSLTACRNQTEFSETPLKPKPVSTSPAPPSSSASVNDSNKMKGSPGQGDDSKTNATNNPAVQKSGFQLDLIDNIVFRDVTAGDEEIGAPKEPFQTSNFVQQLPSAKVFVKDINSKQEKVDIKTRNGVALQGPLLHDASTAAGKPIDVFVVIDDTKDFGIYSGRDRAFAAVKKLVGQVGEMDWNIYVGSLYANGVTQQRWVFSKSKNDTAAGIEAKLKAEMVFGNASDGQRVFKGLTQLANAYKNQDRDTATHLYITITDGPNCKVGRQLTARTGPISDLAICARTANNEDYHRYLLDNHANSADWMNHMSLFAAYYRMSDGPACSTIEESEKANPAEPLKLNSQYADLAFAWEKFVNPSLSAAAAPSFVGDICGQNTDEAWIDRLATKAKEIARTRVPIPFDYDAFTSDPQYNLRVERSSDSAGYLLNSDYSMLHKSVVQLGSNINTSVGMKGYKDNNYRLADFTLGADPEPDSVHLRWDARDEPCAYGPAFDSSISANAVCRHWSNHLYLRSPDVLPIKAPGQSQNFSMAYDTRFEHVKVLNFSAGSNIVAPELVKFNVVKLQNSTDHVSTNSVSVSGKTIAVSFSDELPAGSYEIQYYETAQFSGQSVAVVLAKASTSAKPVCVLPPAAVLFQGGIVVASDPQKAIVGCKVDGASNKVIFDGLLPLNPVTGKRDFVVGYVASLEPVKEKLLNSIPVDGSLKAFVRDFGSSAQGDEIPASSYMLQNNKFELKDALIPGKSVHLLYTVKESKDANCLALSAVPVANSSYGVTYGLPGAEAALLANSYHIQDAPNGKKLFCLTSDLVKPGYQLKVRYTAEQTSQVAP